MNKGIDTFACQSRNKKCRGVVELLVFNERFHPFPTKRQIDLVYCQNPLLFKEVGREAGQFILEQRIGLKWIPAVRIGEINEKQKNRRAYAFMV